MCEVQFKHAGETSDGAFDGRVYSRSSNTDLLNSLVSGFPHQSDEDEVIFWSQD